MGSEDDTGPEVQLSGDEQIKMDLLIKRIANVLYTSGSREQFIEDVKKKITGNSKSYENCSEIIKEDEIETFVVISSGGAACTVEHRVPEKVKGK